MLPIPPYSTWPLHVKLFTEEAQMLWDKVQQPGLDIPLPPGFTYSVEYEGVDGKASVPASERTRTGPIDVKDSMLWFDIVGSCSPRYVAEFTLSHLEKYQTVANNGAYSCSVCDSWIETKRMVGSLHFCLKLKAN
jgi:structure-specific endonuclease subunit SLX1